jgi:hypothetical protein
MAHYPVRAEGQFADAGHDCLGLEAIRKVGAPGAAFMRLGIEKLRSLDLAGFIDQDAQGFPGTVQPDRQQCRKSGLQWVMFYAVCHVVDSFLDVGKNTPKKSPSGEVRRGSVAAQKPAGREVTETMLH